MRGDALVRGDAVACVDALVRGDTVARGDALACRDALVQGGGCPFRPAAVVAADTLTGVGAGEGAR